LFEQTKQILLITLQTATMTTFSGHYTVRKGLSPFSGQLQERNAERSGKILDGWQPYQQHRIDLVTNLTK